MDLGWKALPLAVVPAQSLLECHQVEEIAIREQPLSEGDRSRCAVSRSSMAASCAAYKARRTSLPVPLSVPAACEKRSCDSTTPLIRSWRGLLAAAARRCWRS